MTGSALIHRNLQVAKCVQPDAANQSNAAGRLREDPSCPMSDIRPGQINA
jgi:hypothetical protein